MIVVVPLGYNGQCYGHVHLYAAAERAIDADEYGVLRQVGELIASAIARSRHLDGLQSRTEALQSELIRQQNLEAALREALRSREELEGIMQHSPVVALLLNTTGNWAIDYISRNIAQFGYAPDAFATETMNFLSLVHPDDLPAVRVAIEQFLADGGDELTLVYRVVNSTGESRWVENRLWRQASSPADTWPRKTAPDCAPCLQGILQDITTRRLTEETIRHQAFHDMLTDLPNRVLFHDRLTLALAQARRARQMLAVMFLDLDRFKTINDTLGHEVGDQMLQAVSARLRELLREGDTISRLGGDEFTILLPVVNGEDDAVRVANKILEAFRPAFALAGREVFMTTSIGISLYPKDGQTPEELLQNADTAQYHAKAHGHNTWQFYSPTMYVRALERLEMGADLRKALERREFRLYYQPVVHLASGRVIGAEALVRWHHAERGVLLPPQFMPVAEESGLIEPLGRWILHEACQQARAWQLQGAPLAPIAINYSARQLFQEDAAETLRHEMRAAGLAPASVVLEIPERVVMRDVPESVRYMERLRALGVSLTLDDFGVGFSSLTHLKQLPIAALKIEQTFVQGLPTDANDRAIAAAIIALAQRLRLTVIAEGVETPEQLHILRELRCDCIQGNAYCPPLPIDELAAWLAR